MPRWGEPNRRGRGYTKTDAALDLTAAGAAGGFGHQAYRSYQTVRSSRRLTGVAPLNAAQLAHLARARRFGAAGTAVAAAGLLRRPLTTLVRDLNIRKPQTNRRGQTSYGQPIAERSVATRNDRAANAGKFTRAEEAILAERAWDRPVGRAIPEGSRFTDTGTKRPSHSMLASAEAALERNRRSMRGPLSTGKGANRR